jgi:RNA polymerase sigma-70 factor (ECF subfamily)
MRTATAPVPQLKALHSGSASGQSDLELLRRFAAWSDPDAFAQIVQRYVNVVYATGLRIVGDSARAEDVSQETFFRLMRRPHEINQNLGAWLHRTATHLALDFIRSDTSRRRREITYTRECQHEASTWSELSPAVDQAISELPEDLRTLLVGHYLLGRSQAELAHEMNQSPATVSRRMQRGLDELRQRLRLKGICALPAALATLLCHVSARQAPASLVREMGKMTMVHASSSFGAAKAAALRAAQGGTAPAAKLSLSDQVLNMLNSNFSVAMVGMLCAIVTLQLIFGSWTLPRFQSSPPIHEPEPAAHHVQQASR